MNSIFWQQIKIATPMSVDKIVSFKEYTKIDCLIIEIEYTAR